MDDFLKLNKNEFEKELEKRQIEIHIKIQQRNGRKCWTFVEGLDKLELEENEKLDDFMKKITKHFKQTFNCGASIIKPENTIQLNGDQKDNIKDYLIKKGLVKEDQIKMHGI